MLSEPMQKHLNDQIAAEMYSSYLYLGFSCELEKMGLQGFSHWFLCQSKEEWRHAQKIINYMLEKDCSVALRDIPATAITWECPCGAMREALEHEEKITNRINTIMTYALENMDWDTVRLMQWYVEEQHEEEATLKPYIKQLDMIGEDNNGLIFIDKKLSERHDH